MREEDKEKVVHQPLTSTRQIDSGSMLGISTGLIQAALVRPSLLLPFSSSSSSLTPLPFPPQVLAAPVLLPKAIGHAQRFLNPSPKGQRTSLGQGRPPTPPPPPDDARYAALRLFVLTLGVSVSLFTALSPPHVRSLASLVVRANLTRFLTTYRTSSSPSPLPTRSSTPSSPSSASLSTYDSRPKPSRKRGPPPSVAGPSRQTNSRSHSVFRRSMHGWRTSRTVRDRS